MAGFFPPPRHSMLLAIDVQERLARAMTDFERPLDAMCRALRTAALLRVDVVAVEQYPKGLGPTVRELRDLLPPGTPLLSKTAFTCWACAEFATAVEAVRPQALVLMGMETHVCVQQTALGALKRGYEVVLLADAVCSRKPVDRENALHLMRAEGVRVTTLESLGFDWVYDATHPDFKAFSAIVK